MKKDFIIKFYGVRGSYPTPGKSTVEFGGNTACIKVLVRGHLIVFDAGTGIIKLGEDLLKEYSPVKKNIVMTLLLSHSHFDHTNGFPFFGPAYIGTSRIYVFGPKTTKSDLRDALATSMVPPYFPLELEELKSMKSIRNIDEAEVILLTESDKAPVVRHVFREEKIKVKDPVIITILKSYAHPKEGVYIYKIKWRGKSIVYSTDVEGFIGGDARLIWFAKNADVLIHDAQYISSEYTGADGPFSHTKQGWGHSTPEMACEVAKKAKVKKLILFHHDPKHDDATIKNIEQNARKFFKATYAAKEGMVIRI